MDSTAAQVLADARILTGKDGYSLDFIDFWRGAPEIRTGIGSKSWSGGFRGRPELADALWPVAKEFALDWKRGSITQLAYALREFFRFLDSYEHRFANLVGIEQITEAIGNIWLHPVDGAWAAPKRRVFSVIGQILRRGHAIGQKKISFVWPPTIEKKSYNDNEVIAEEEARAALHLLKREAQTVLARWRRADMLAAAGRNLLVFPRDSRRHFGFKLTEADLHATYRAVIAQTGNPLPTSEDINWALTKSRACKFQESWIFALWHLESLRSGMYPDVDKAIAAEGKLPPFGLGEIQIGLYPTWEDIHCLSQLFMARSGWNPSTVAALDISNEGWVAQHGDPANDLWVIESWKDRSQTWQQTVCRGKTTTAPYQIVNSLLVRTKPLRELLTRDSTRAGQGTNLEVALRSPWLCAGQRKYSGKVCALSSRTTSTAVYWHKKVAERNASVVTENAEIEKENKDTAVLNAARAPDQQLAYHPLKLLIPGSMTPSDWRDIYASHVFVDSRYSWLMVQWALGHKHLTSTRYYLRNWLWRRYSEKKLREVQTLVFDELRHGRLDFVVLRARADLGILPGEDDIKRLQNHRAAKRELELTPAGYHCPSPLNPPTEMDPGNPGDGSMRARCGDRCPGCPIAQAVDPNYMAKTLVQLRLIRRQVSVAAWTESQLAADLDVLNRDLEQWPANEVACLIKFWEEEFRTGRQQLIPWAGLN